MTFIPLLALVISSQIGSGALSSPAIFAQFGYKSLYAWLVASIGAMSLATVFAKLCQTTQDTGGPHVYATAAFGDRIGFYVGWIYWFVCWISTIVVLIACTSYLAKFLHIQNHYSILVLGLIIWLGVNYLNIIGTELSAKVEVILTILKVVFFATFIILPLCYFDSANLANYTIGSNFNTSILAALWGFVGVETVTAPSGTQSKHVGRAVLFGTGIVALIYILANMAAIGSVHYSILSVSLSPYDPIAYKVFGSSYGTNLAAFLLCIGSLNAWVLAAGQIGYDLAQRRFLPQFFAHSPRSSIVFSGLGITLIWTLGMLFNVLNHIMYVIDALAPSFVLIYLICACSLFKITHSSGARYIAMITSIFCIYLLAYSSILSYIITLTLGCLGWLYRRTIIACH